MSPTWWCEHAWVDGRVVDGALVTASNGVIVAIEPDQPPAGKRLHGLVIPGLANAHSHAFHRALRTHTQRGGGSFWTWRDAMYRIAERLTPQNYLELAAAVYAEMALAGITAVGEFHYLHHGPDGVPYTDANEMGHALVAAAAAAGIRLTLLDACYLSAGPSGQPLDGPQVRFGDGDADRWAQRTDALLVDTKGDEHVLIGAAVHSVRAVPADQLERVASWADAHSAPLHVHSSEQVAEVEQCQAAYGCTPTALLGEHGALGPRTTAVHATHLTDQDIVDMHASSTGTCFCPTTERDLGDGIGPAPALLAGPGLFSLGTDSHAMIDVLEEARAVELDERLAGRRRGTISAARLLEAATRYGHQALGWADAGRLEPGARADLVAIDLASVRTAGGGATAENVVFAASAADVTDVIVDGRTVVADRHHRVEVGRALDDVIGRLWENT
ncbi:formimidoylglutamate deiminase [Mycolicibacterium psychrotolerans]|uniref:Formimidoylglutamate deiminase n=1 Tax=Mycolicibacterium psychrotolerans TaxID=216929 RepID=A0A7I7ML46_9MYCO|nr:formimidoylglutamate deiminase [Mycolicibacterium psychrotolerans]BBX71969.1 formimidoylglutamate deiminase [Mycolicibacterium psychrotolerans]